MPAFNRLEYLPQAVQSVFAQTYQNWELIIADDGSEEETRSYLRALAARERVTVVWLAHTGNPAAARNAALSVARGEYVAFLDSDDVWMPEKLERQMAGLDARRANRWSYTPFTLIDRAGVVQPRPVSWPNRLCRGAILEHLLTAQAAVWTSAVVAERGLIMEVGGFDERMPQFEDYDLWLRLACRSEVDLIEMPLVCMRKHDQHYTRGGLEMLSCRCRALLKLRAGMSDRRLNALIDRLHALAALELVRVQANTDRRAAAGLLLDNCKVGWRYPAWWGGVPRVALKVAAPRRLLDLYRSARASAKRFPALF
jgi:glycosyltransferase involved in cell wall biosynthesis